MRSAIRTVEKRCEIRMAICLSVAWRKWSKIFPSASASIAACASSFAADAEATAPCACSRHRAAIASRLCPSGHYCRRGTLSARTCRDPNSTLPWGVTAAYPDGINVAYPGGTCGAVAGEGPLQPGPAGVVNGPVLPLEPPRKPRRRGCTRRRCGCCVVGLLVAAGLAAVGIFYV